MKILYHHRTQAEDGQAVHIRSLQSAFREEGHQVHEFALVRRQEGESASPEPAPRRFSPWALVARSPRFVRELAEYCYAPVARGRLIREGRERAADFLYERYAFGNTPVWRQARRLRIPLVLEVNSPMVLELSRTRGLSFPGLAERLERHVFRSAELVCVVTAVLRDMLLEMGVERERLLVTPNGVHLEHYAWTTPTAMRGARRAGPRRPARWPVWCSASSATTATGTARPGRRGPGRAGADKSAHLVLVGEGPAHEELVARAAEARCAPSGALRRARARTPRIPALLARLRRRAGAGDQPVRLALKLHEYMAAGLAVVAPDQPNLREVLETGATPAGRRPATATPWALALVRRLASDADLRARLGNAGRVHHRRVDL